MKPIIHLIFLFSLVQVSWSKNLYKASTSVEFLESLETILWHMQRRPQHHPHLEQEVHLEPGFYQIPQNEPILSGYKAYLHKRGRTRSLNPFLKVIVDYPWPYGEEVIFEGRLLRILKDIQESLHDGLKLSREILYVARTPAQFYKALELSIENRQDTTIRLPFCHKKGCIQRADWAGGFKALKMVADDGMRLRIKSNYFSLDQSKFLFFERDLAPFLNEL